MPDFDVLVGGFPCQSFSVAGKQRGFNDARGQLFFDIIRIVEAKKPKCVFLENVKGLTWNDDGKTFWMVKQKLREAGYKVFAEVLNSADYGIPQNRQRVYIIAFRNDLNIISFEFPTPIPREKSFKEFLEPNPPESVFLTGKQLRRIKGIGTVNSFGGRLSKNSVYGCITASYKPDNGNSMKFFRDDRVSILSPLECERLQTFPEGWTSNLLSDRDRYKVLGNAVTTTVISKIVKKIVEAMPKPE